MNVYEAWHALKVAVSAKTTQIVMHLTLDSILQLLLVLGGQHVHRDMLYRHQLVLVSVSVSNKVQLLGLV